MKFLIMLLIPFNVSAVTIGQYLDSLDGTSVQAFELQAKEVTYEKKSNYFDTETNYAIGRFKLETGSVSGEENLLAKSLQKIETVDNFLKKKKSSFNDLSTKKPHESFIFLNDFQISQNSSLYPELNAIFQRLQKKSWKQIEGIRLSGDLKTLTEISEGKIKTRKEFNSRFHCKKPEAPTVCQFKDHGFLYLK